MVWWQRPGAAVAASPSGTDVRLGRALTALVGRLRGMKGARLLDLGFTSGPNIDFFARLGCRVHVDDYVAALLSRPHDTPVPAEPKEPEDRAGPMSMPPRARRGGGAPLADQPTAGFQAILCWDLFDYIGGEEAASLAREVGRVTAEDGHLYAFFGPPRPGEARLPLRYRIEGDGQVLGEEVRGPRIRPVHVGNREILRLFPDFDIRQTILLKNGVREMLLHKRTKARTEMPTTIDFRG